MSRIIRESKPPLIAAKHDYYDVTHAAHAPPGSQVLLRQYLPLRPCGINIFGTQAAVALLWQHDY